eukprot:jgi/Orpsp1_1/1190283/evm.model.d7180000077953.1
MIIIKYCSVYYDMTKISTYNIDIAVLTKISIIGNSNRTIFDYNHNMRGTMVIAYSSFIENTIKFENIIFQNYDTKGVDYNGSQIIYVISNNYYFKFSMVNCIFQNNNHHILKIEVNSNRSFTNNRQVLFHDCQFYNNSERFLNILNDPYRLFLDSYKKLNIEIKNCKFINNRGLISSYNAQYFIENCYFEELEINSDTKAALFYSSYSEELLSIKNSLFKDINIQNSYPLINSQSLTL